MAHNMKLSSTDTLAKEAGSHGSRDSGVERPG